MVLRLAHKKVEHFFVLFLDAANQMIKAEDMFHGTLTQTSVYPREVVRRALPPIQKESYAMSVQNSRESVSPTRRIVAVLEHDGIPADRRVSYLAKACGFSKSTARRLLNGADLMRMKMNNLGKLGVGLDVGCAWLYCGSLQWPHARTWRIEIEHVKGYPADDATRIVRMLSASVMGHGKADNLMRLVVSGQMDLMQAAQLL